jgi:hypothetical protein
MKKKLIRILNYLTISLGIKSRILETDLELCMWLKNEYPQLNGRDLLILTASIIRSIPTMYELNPLAKESLNNAVNNLLSNTNKQ